METTGRANMVEPRVHQRDGVAVLDFGRGSHSLDESTVGSIQHGILNAANADPPLLVVDLSGIEFFGSSFIETLFRLWSRMNGRGGRFALSGLSPYCREVIEVTKLDQLWPIYGTVDEAILGVKAPL
jgi:anti-sigma B factor antagonist